MTDLYGDQHKHLQLQFDSLALAERVQQLIVAPTIDEQQRGFIESRDMFFLTTIDHRGYPTCSYKGGARGFVKVIDDTTLAFPSYDGNGMFLSMGNITANNKVGLLFIDFETPHRVRVHGEAVVSSQDSLLSEYPEAQLMVRVTVTEIFVNCPRYIHRYDKITSSPYVPGTCATTPIAKWKQINALQDVLSASDLAKVQALGEIITPEQYAEFVMKGDG